MLLLLDPLGRDRALELVGPIMAPYPRGLLVEDLGPVTANDSYAPPDVWESFRRDPYHSPAVVWGVPAPTSQSDVQTHRTRSISNWLPLGVM